MAAVPQQNVSAPFKDQPCVVRVLSGMATGVALGVVGAGMVVTWAGPSKNPKLNTLKQFTKLASAYVPATGFVGTVFAATECAYETSRGKPDLAGSAIAGCAAGTIVGLQRRSFSSTCLGCVSFGAFAAAADFASAFQDLQRPAPRTKSSAPIAEVEE